MKRVIWTTTAQKCTAVLFMAVVCSSAVVQTVVELWRGDRPHALNVLLQLPDEEFLRAFERRLEDESVVAGALRPWAQHGQFVLLRDGGEKALVGYDGWLFYQPAVRYITLRAPASNPSSGDPLRAILSLQQQLAFRGIELLVVPVPDKATVYPEMLAPRADDEQIAVCHRTQEFMARLQTAGVDVVDLFDVFHRAKQMAHERASAKLYMARDTHWSPAGAQLAARSVALRVRQLMPALQGIGVYRRQQVSVARIGDLVEMLDVRQIEHWLGREHFICQRVVERGTGALYRDRVEAKILVLGDSFLRIFQRDEPGSAGFIAQLACELQRPLTSIVNDGGGATLVRQELARRPKLLKNKRLVIWEFAERDIGGGTDGWQDVPLPASPWK